MQPKNHTVITRRTVGGPDERAGRTTSLAVPDRTRENATRDHQKIMWGEADICPEPHGTVGWIKP